MQKDPKTGAFIGQAGVKYGLQRPTAKPTQNKTAVPRPLNIFGDDDSDEDDVGAQISRQAEKKKRDAKAAQLQAAALAQDPNAFAYDELYEDMQGAKQAPRLQEKVARKPKYIEMLLKQAEERKREQDIGWEKRQVKEREKEDYLFEGKERFVTSAYRKKLEEDKKWMEAERLRELEEAALDVRKVGHMGNFYKNLLTKNVAFGTARDKAAAAKDAKAGGEREPSAHPAASSAPDARLVAKAQQMEEELDQYERMRLEAERAFRERATRGQQEPGEERADRESGDEDTTGKNTRGAKGADRGVDRAAVQGREEGEEQEERGHSDAGNNDVSANASRSADRGVVDAVSQGEGISEQPSKDAEAKVPGGRRKADDQVISAARERYLARKKARTG